MCIKFRLVDNEIEEQLFIVLTIDVLKDKSIYVIPTNIGNHIIN